MSDPLTPPSALFWKRKLAAFLHDSPSKPLDIKSHELRAESALSRAGLVDDQGLTAYFNKSSDHTAAAADRLPFPHWRSGVRCAYDAKKNPLRHPLGSNERLARDDFRLTAVGAEEIEQSNQPSDLITGYPTDSAEDWRSRFFAHWRLWRFRATEAHAGFAALPADTRIPDHTIWTHMGVVSALEGCNGEPALLKFQLGPVQDFIAAARSTRDLWSGSMILSWLMASGLARLAELVGPDSVIFPNLWGQPLFDLRFRESIWNRLKADQRTSSAWDDFQYASMSSADDLNTPLPLHTPNLPNVFLALVPASQAESIARSVKSAIQTEWKAICDAVLDFAQPLFDLPDSTVAKDARRRFDSTTDQHAEIAWQSLPISGDIQALLETARQLLPRDCPPEAPTTNEATNRIETLVNYFTSVMPYEDRDGRYYVGGDSGPKTKLNNLGAAWSLAVSLVNWQFDANRNLRCFEGRLGSGVTGNAVSDHGGKDALNGRDPMLFGGSKEWLSAVHELPRRNGADWKKLFRHPDELGALTLVKRLWHLAYLAPKNRWGIEPHPMPNTHELACGEIDQNDESDVTSMSEDDGKYYAVIAFDGDSIGQWVSGAKSPAFGQQISPYSNRPDHPSPREYFAALDEGKNQSEKLLSLQRPLSPSYHLQFSETLSNFALHCAPRIVGAYRGKLLYAGGDDVLAMVPAPYALACINDLQRVFRGLPPLSFACGIQAFPDAPGFLTIAKDHSDARRPIPIILPGPRTTASAGLALAHFKQPLQDVVNEARRAEKRAKKLAAGKHALGHALGVTVLKRSGETTVWDTRFDHDSTSPEVDSTHRGGLAAIQWLLCALGCNIGSTPDRKRPTTDEVLSGRFPHRLSSLLEPYVSAQGLSDAHSVNSLALFQVELDHVLDRQRGSHWDTSEGKETRRRLRKELIDYVKNLPGETPAAKFQPVIQMLATAAFLARQPQIASRS